MILFCLSWIEDNPLGPSISNRILGAFLVTKNISVIKYGDTHPPFFNDLLDVFPTL